MVCPWNIRFAQTTGDPAFEPRPGLINPPLDNELVLTPEEFNRKYKNSPIKRAKRRGYLRNAAVAAGNSHRRGLLSALELVRDDDEPLVRESVEWAITKLNENFSENLGSER